MSDFNVIEFLEEYGGGGYDDGFRGEVLPQIVEAGIGVFAGKESKFFPTMSTNAKLVGIAKKKAEEYATTLNLGYEPKVVGSIRQTWFGEILGREKQPAWNDGKWEEMKRRTVIQIDGAYVETGDWTLFKSQWEGDQAALKSADFGKKLWVHCVYEPHPDFDKNNPTEYTVQMRDGQMVLDERTGEPRPKYFRVVKEVIGETREQAEAWYAEHAGETAVAGEAKTNDLDAKLMALREKLDAKVRKEFADDAGWLDCSKSIFASLHNKEDVTAWYEVGVSKEVVGEIEKLTAEFPAF